eukprot:SAG31_NODE_25807_length_453_cov_1.935028_1_plen_131_part_10
MTGEQAAALSAAKQEAVKHLAAEHERATAELTSTVAGLREDHALELAESRESESEQIAALEARHREALELKDRALQSEASDRRTEREEMMNTQRLILQDLESSASARLSTELDLLRMRMTGEQAAALSAAK